MHKLITVFCLALSLVYLPVVVAAETGASAVVISFADRTPYNELHANQIIEQSMLENLMYLPQLSLMEHHALQETLSVEQSLNKPLGSVSETVGTGDFRKALDAIKNGIGRKGTGETVSPAKTRMLGKKYHADYLIHGTIDYLGKNRHETIIPLPGSLFSINNPFMEAWVTVRIIRADTGKIVWCRQEKGVSKDCLLRYKEMKKEKITDVTMGSKDFNNKMFLDAMDKISVKIVKAMKQDILDKKLVL